jgi:predicted metalloendopeptidase
LGKSIWAFTNRRDELFAIQRRFASYRSIFQRSLLLLNEGHNRDQAQKAKEIKDQARKYAKERKEEDKARKKDAQKQAKELKEVKEIVKKLQSPKPANTVPEKIIGEKEIQEWLVNQKGMNSE